jgi:argininosuccinate lyase
MGIYRSRLEGRYSGDTASFVCSLADDARIFEQDIDGTEAHEIMLHEQGLLTRRELAEILGSLETISGEWVRGRVKLEGDYEDVHELIEARVIELVGPETGGKLQLGRSRNDQVGTDIRMRLRADLLATSEAVLSLIGVSLSKADRTKSTLMLLYTHTQHAQTGTFGHYFLALAEVLLRDFQRLQDCYDRVNLSPLGAGPIGGTTVPVNRYRTGQLLGFDGLVYNSIDATSCRDFMVEALAILANLMVTLSRVAEDIILWSSSEFGFVELTDEFASVSSIMPQKKNPTVLELIRAKASRVSGDLTSILGALKGLPSGYSSDLQETKPLLWDGSDQALSSVQVLTKVLSTLTIHEQRINETTKKSYVFAVDLAERLALEKVLPFRQSHQLVGALIRDMVSKGLEPGKLTPELICNTATRVLGHGIQVPESMVEDIADPRKGLINRRSQGSPNPEDVENRLKELHKLTSEAAAILSTRRQKLESSKAELAKTVRQYIEDDDARK